MDLTANGLWLLNNKLVVQGYDHPGRKTGFIPCLSVINVYHGYYNRHNIADCRAWSKRNKNIKPYTFDQIHDFVIERLTERSDIIRMSRSGINFEDKLYDLHEVVTQVVATIDNFITRSKVLRNVEWPQFRRFTPRELRYANYVPVGFSGLHNAFFR